MFHFFQASSKVQKDRLIMRETDARMAKYSRRGLIFNFIAFLVCLVGGRFIDQNRELTIILASGLLLITFLRGLYLFRFDQLYPRGPARWRNLYFVVTLFGAMWWGVILASITLVLGLQYETPLLWLYTVVFFSTTAHAFAPYHRFLSYYQFFGIIPAAAAAFVVGGSTAYIYGSLMLVFYLILSHQCRLISDNYWEKLEAGYALGRRAISDEQEKIDSRATLSLSREFLENLADEFTVSMSGFEQNRGAITDDVWNTLKTYEDNINLYRSVITRELKIDSSIFNIRHELQYLVSEFVEYAEQRNVHLETSLSPNLPMRLIGDSVRFAQIVRTLLNLTLSTAKDTAVILEVQFLREYEAAGELYVSVRRVKSKSSIQLFGEHSKELEPQSLALTTAKGLAELMNGDIEIIQSPMKDYQIRFNARLGIADRAGKLDFHKDRFHGKQILLVSSNPAIVDLKRVELDALGFSISTETNLKRVTSTLQGHLNSGVAIDNILIYHDPESDQCATFLDGLRAADDLKTLNKIIVASPSSQQKLEDLGFDQSTGFYFVPKPLGLFELESAFDYIYAIKGDDQLLSKCSAGTIVVVKHPALHDEVMQSCNTLHSQTVIEVDATALSKTLASLENALVVVPCELHDDVKSQIDAIRKVEQKNTEKESFIPIIGVGKNCSETDVSAFENGFDDYFNISDRNCKSLESTIRYWRSLDL